MEVFREALMLLVIGMGTVFLILLFVIKMSELLIFAVNKLAPMQEVAKQVKTVSVARPSATGITKQKIAAITTAINIASGGKVTILKIEKQ